MSWKIERNEGIGIFATTTYALLIEGEPVTVDDLHEGMTADFMAITDTEDGGHRHEYTEGVVLRSRSPYRIQGIGDTNWIIAADGGEGYNLPVIRVNGVWHVSTLYRRLRSRKKADE